MIFAEIVCFVNIKIQPYLRVQKNHKFKNREKVTASKKDRPDDPYLHVTPLPAKQKYFALRRAKCYRVHLYEAFKHRN